MHCFPYNTIYPSQSQVGRSGHKLEVLVTSGNAEVMSFKISVGTGQD